CPNDASFLTQYDRGRKEYLLEKQLSEIKSDLQQTERDIEQLERQIRNENDSKQRDYYRAQRERAIRHYEGLRRDYNRIRFPDRVIQFSFGN
ncbi:MAG: DNA repair protein, partial [Aeromonas sp.]|nr:DNA repair protein [Aeromonas sp.]